MSEIKKYIPPQKRNNNKNKEIIDVYFMNKIFKFSIFKNDDICNKMKKYKAPYETFILHILFCLNEKEYYIRKEKTKEYKKSSSYNKTFYFDIGGYIGDTSIFLKEYFDYLYVFEPSRIIFNKLNENINLNKIKNINNIIINNCAIEDGTKNEIKIGKSLEIIQTKDKENVKHYGSTKQVENEEKNYEIIKAISINDYINTLNNKNEILNTDNQIIIKIDIEGFEYNAIKGFENLLSSHNLIIIYEYNERQDKNNSITKKLYENGYKVVIYIHHNNYMVMKPETFEKISKKYFCINNRFFGINNFIEKISPREMFNYIKLFHNENCIKIYFNKFNNEVLQNFILERNNKIQTIGNQFGIKLITEINKLEINISDNELETNYIFYHSKYETIYYYEKLINNFNDI
jgi:FkbM family methyltransferase